MSIFRWKTPFLICIFFQFWSCSPTDNEPNGPFTEIGFKFTDTDREIYFKDYDHFLESKPDSFFTGPYLIDHDEERVELTPLVTGISNNRGLAFYYIFNFDSVSKYYDQGVRGLDESLKWIIHFGPDRIDTMKFGFSKEILDLWQCDTVYPERLFEPTNSLHGLKFIQYNSDTIMSQCLGHIQLDTNYFPTNSDNEILIPITK